MRVTANRAANGYARVQRSRSAGSQAMNAATATKSPAANNCEGIVLTALQALPAFTGSALTLKLFDAHMTNEPAGAAIFVLMASATLGLVTPWLAPKFPKGFKNHEPLFFDATLPFAEKIQRWLDKPGTARQLLQMLFMVAMLAIAVMTVR
jgi:hypothetical protein